MDVAGLFFAQKETNSTESMDAGPHPRPPANLRLDFTYCAETPGVKQASPTEQDRVKNLRRARNGCEPFQPANCESENHK